MKYLKSFQESNLVSVDPDMEKIDRTKELSEVEFLNILHTECKNFSFMNDLLWRGKPKKYDLELFEPGYRNTKGMTFVNFFNKIENDPNYPVVRKKSLIGGTHKENVERITEFKSYMVIPFDDSEIVFCPIIDLMGIQDSPKSGKLKDGSPVTKDVFVKVNYTKDFKVPTVDIETIRDKYKLRGTRATGYEFFTSSPCLLVYDDKINWLRNNI
jgi:hypothetical protein